MRAPRSGGEAVSSLTRLPFELATFLAALCGGFAPGAQESKSEDSLRALAGRCGSEIEWAGRWVEAAQRARRERKLVLVYARLYGDIQITDDVMAGPFMDLDVVDLIRERFVAWRYRRGEGAPFELQDAYGMGPSTFGSSLLLVTPQGAVVADTHAWGAAGVEKFLLDNLRKRPEHAGLRDPPPGLAGPDLAEWHLRRGEFDRAEAILADPSTAREHLLRASILRRLRRADDALAELRDARGMLRGAAAADLAVDEGVLLLRAGRLEEASSRFAEFVERFPKSSRFAEAKYWLGACQLRRGRRADAAATWEELAATRPKDRWAWKAAASRTGTRFSLGFGERLEWPPEEYLEVVESPEPPPPRPPRAREAVEAAVAYLLRRQRADGSWMFPGELDRFGEKDPADLTHATTALCGLALVPRSDRPEAAEAARRALRYLLAAREAERASERTPFFLDYSVWSEAYVLRFLVAAAERDLVPRPGIAAAIAETIGELRRKQKETGGWSYYVTNDLAAKGEPSRAPMSFVTAAVLHALVDAREAGFDVPETMLRRSLDGLERMRKKDETFRYMGLTPADEGAAPTRDPSGEVGRGPACELALLRGGRGSPERVRAALELFLEHRRSYAKERWKPLMHAGPAGQGSHYLLFDYGFAAAAARSLPEPERAQAKDIVLGLVLETRTAEGAFVDNPILGFHCGTALALLALDELERIP